MEKEKESLAIQPASALDPENPTPGIYQDVPDSKYFDVDAINNSKLTTILDETPAGYKYQQDHPDTSSSSSQLLGSVAHVRLLQPEQFDERAMTIPTANKNSNKFQRQLEKTFPDAHTSKDNRWSENLEIIEDCYPDAIIGDQSDFQKAEAMIKKLRWADREWGGWILDTVIDTGYAEVVLVWEDPDYGFLCKAKLDWWNPKLEVFMDYKTTRDASPQKFIYSVSDYGYHRQQVHYYDGCVALGMNIETSMILAQETDPPYIHHWYEFLMDSSMAGIGNKARGTEWEVANYQLDRAKKTLAYCKENDYWPGYTVLKEKKPISPLALKFDDYKAWEDDPFTDEDDNLPGMEEDGQDPVEKLKEVRGEDGQGKDPKMDMTTLAEDVETYPNKIETDN